MGLLGRHGAGSVGPSDDAGGDFWRRRIALWVALIAVLVAANVVFALLSPTGGARDAAGDDARQAAQAAGEDDVRADDEEMGGMTFRDASRLDALTSSSKAELPRVVRAWAALRGREAPAEVGVAEDATATQVGEKVTLDVDGARLELVRESSWRATDGYGTLEIAGDASAAEEPAHSSDTVALDDPDAMTLVVGNAPTGAIASAWADWAEANGVDDPDAARAVVSSGVPSADGATVSFTVECGEQAFQATLDATSGGCSFARDGDS